MALRILHEAASAPGTQPGVRLVPAGAFDAAAAARLLQALEAHRPAATPLTVDFSKATRVYEAALAQLVDGLEDGPRLALQVTGLTVHLVRLLTYLGVDPDTLQPRPERRLGAVAAGGAKPDAPPR